jgi:cystathionine gamma-synthase
VDLGNDAYGGTHRLIDRIHGSWGVLNTTVDLTDLAEAESALSGGAARILWIETPSNPLMKISDISALADLAHREGALVVVDNTFASPALQQPLSLGADVVVHSATKYLGGHSDVIGGAVIVRDAELAERVAFQQFAAGAILAPQEAWLTIRGIKTLGIRMQRHSQNAGEIAERLAGHPAVERVFYPGLTSHPGHDLAARQMSGFGGMLSLALAGGPEAARRLAESTRLFQLAESLGGVESLIGYPSEMTHASVRGTALEVPANIVRLSVGIEEISDLLSDLDDALARL